MPEERRVRELVEEAAEEYLSGPPTVEVTAWDDGDFRVVAFRTIKETYPDDLVPDGEDALPFYREEVFYSSTQFENTVWLRVIRMRTGRNMHRVVYETPVAFVGPRDHRTPGVSDLGLGRFGSSDLIVNGKPAGRLDSFSVEVSVPDPDDPEAVSDYVRGLRRDRELSDSLLSVQERVNDVYENAQATANEEGEPVRVSVGPVDGDRLSVEDCPFCRPEAGEYCYLPHHTDDEDGPTYPGAAFPGRHG